jgi:hypothetical protein
MELLIIFMSYFFMFIKICQLYLIIIIFHAEGYAAYSMCC